MCYHATQERKTIMLERRYGVRRNEKFEIDETSFINYHLAAYNHPEMLIIPQESKEELHPAIWGILEEDIPGHKQNEYYKEKGVYVCNAQSEKLFEYDLYNNSAYTRRCIIPISGFFEPHYFMGVSYPFYFERKDKDTISVAGIYSITKDTTVSFTMLTKKASQMFSDIHNRKKRQIIILDKENEKEWLRDDLNEQGINDLIKASFNDNELKAYPTSRDLFYPDKATNHEGIKERVEYPEFSFNQEIQKYL